MTRLIVCCDGTWNRADQPAPTNVRRICQAIDESDGQLVKYEPGVGTRVLERIRGGAFGFGLSRNVKDCYAWLVEHYEPGDELFLFGFSRGAFTARSLAGLVRNSGILKRENAGMVDAAYKLYRSREPGNAPREENAARFRADNSHPDATIQFIGVWDTVGALGIPIDGFRPPLLTKRWSFHDTTLSSKVVNAYHAISIDERRRPFAPTLWIEKPGEPPPPGQTVCQVWFAGVHADVGGGYPDRTLADIPLRWMADRAQQCGLRLKPDGLQLAPDPRGAKHDSLGFFYRLFRPYDRELKSRDGDAIQAWLASTARVRWEDDSAYDPPGLSDWVKRARPVRDLDS
jgi:uncharacterized protein (DUF2235 family)